MYSALSGQVGNFRESFLTSMFLQQKRSIYACKDERRGDFIVDSKTLEIGGRNKSIKNSDDVIRDEVDMPGEQSLPLWSFGMMY